MKTFTFEKESSGRWYVVLPEWTGAKADLEMVAGADDFLSLLSEGENAVELFIDLKPFERSEELSLTNRGTSEGGGYYLLKTFNGIEFNYEMWLCDVTKFVFGHLPEKIYFLKAN